MSHTPQPPPGVRRAPKQARSRERLRRVLDAAEQVLSEEGSAALTTARIAQVAGVPVGSLYHYFDDKEGIVDALAVLYWSDLQDLVNGIADVEEREPFDDP